MTLSLSPSPNLFVEIALPYDAIPIPFDAALFLYAIISVRFDATTFLYDAGSTRFDETTLLYDAIYFHFDAITLLYDAMVLEEDSHHKQKTLCKRLEKLYQTGQTGNKKDSDL